MSWSIYSTVTGLFTGMVYAGAEATLADNLPPDCAAVEGAYDPLSQRVDLNTGAVVDYQPTPPADTELSTWSWDAESRRWVPAPTLAALRATAIAAVQAAIAAQEAYTPRPVREISLAMLASTTPPPAAINKLQAIDANCTTLRAVIAAMNAAPDAAALAAITWTEPLPP